MDWTADGLARFIEVILAGGVGYVLKEVVRHFIRKDEEREPAKVRITEQNITERALLNLSKSNDELTDDITRTRAHNEALEKRNRDSQEWWEARWREREAWWGARESEMQQEIDTMRQKMVELINELDQMRERFERKMREE